MMRANRVKHTGGSTSRDNSPGGASWVVLGVVAFLVPALLLAAAAPAAGLAEDVKTRMGSGEQDAPEEGNEEGSEGRDEDQYEVGVQDPSQVKKKMGSFQESEQEEQEENGTSGADQPHRDAERPPLYDEDESDQNGRDGQNDDEGDNGSQSKDLPVEVNLNEPACLSPLQLRECDDAEVAQPSPSTPAGPQRDGDSSDPQAAGAASRTGGQVFIKSDGSETDKSGWDPTSGSSLILLLAWTMFVASTGSFGRSAARREDNEQALSRLDPAARRTSDARSTPKSAPRRSTTDRR